MKVYKKCSEQEVSKRCETSTCCDKFDDCSSGRHERFKQVLLRLMIKQRIFLDVL